MQAALEPRPAGALPHGNLRAILARPGFRRLLVARLLSQLGDGWFQAGLASSVFFNPDKAPNPVAVAAAFAVLLVPYSTLGPFVGVFLDRWSRRNTLVTANSIRAVMVLPAAMLVWRGSETVWFVLSALLIIALNRFCLAGLSAAQPHVVPEDRLVTANSFATTFGTVIYTVGLASAGAIFHLTGTGDHPYAIVAAAATLGYASSAVLTRVSFGAGDLGPDDATAGRSVLAGLAHTARGMVSGVRHLLGRPVASTALAANALHRGLYGVLAITVLLLYRNYYSSHNAGASMMGLLSVAAAAALGSFIAALITPRVTRRIGGRTWLVVMFGAVTILVPVLILPYRPLLTVLAAMCVSLVTQGVKIVTDTALQVEIEDDYRGRVFSINDTAFNLLFVGGIYLGARLLPVDGHAPVLMAGVGVGYALLTLWYSTATPRPAQAAS
jgi:MFS family permease